MADVLFTFTLVKIVEVDAYYEACWVERVMKATL